MVDKSTGKLVSIITPTYNHAEFIGACIESVLAQTYPSWEMIIIDDGSTDGTGDVVARYEDDRIRYIRQPNRGVERLTETYNKALSLARGEYIAILEGDDYWPDYKLSKQVLDFSDPEVVLSAGYTRIISADGNDIGRIPKTRLPEGALRNTPVGRAGLYMLDPFVLTFIFPVSVVIRKSALEGIGGFQGFPNLPLVDYPTFLRLTLEGKFAFHKDVLGFWKRHAQSTTRNKFPQILDGAQSFTEAFLEENRSRLPCSRRELKKIEMNWVRVRTIQNLMLGRWFLFERRWDKARRAFRKISFWPLQPIVFTAREAGIVLSYLHLNMEFVAHMLARPTIKQVLMADKGDLIVSKDMLEEF